MDSSKQSGIDPRAFGIFIDTSPLQNAYIKNDQMHLQRSGSSPKIPKSMDLALTMIGFAQTHKSGAPVSMADLSGAVKLDDLKTRLIAKVLNDQGYITISATDDDDPTKPVVSATLKGTQWFDQQSRQQKAN